MDFANFVGKYMALIVLLFAAVALFYPSSGMWIQTTWINYLLMIVMFAMGLTMSFKDFGVVFTHPRDIVIGCIAQFTIMPLLAVALGTVMGLEQGLMIGVVLVGCCPGGTASNVITYLAKGDVALSVGMTSVNTLLAPVVTPLLVFLILGQSVSVDVFSMFLNIIQVVIIPIALGLAINHFFGKYTKRVSTGLPVISIAAIVLIMMCVVSHNSTRILDASLIVFTVVILHNLLGYLCGFAVAKALHMPVAKQRAMMIEVGMQNSGLASSLAATSFPGYVMATVPGAIFSVWHNLSGALIASYCSHKGEVPEENSDDQLTS